MSSHSAVEIFTSLRYDPQCAKAEPEHGPFYMLHHHRDRLLEAAAFFDNESVVVLYAGEYGLDWLRRTLVGRVKDWREKESDAEADDNTPLKIRVNFTSTGYMTTEMSPVPPVSREALYPDSLSPPPSDTPSTKPFRPSAATGGAVHSISTSTSQSRPTWYLTLDTESTASGPMSTFKTLNRKVYDDARARVLPTAQKENQQYANHEVLMYDEDGNASETSLCSVYFWRHGQWVTPPVANLAGLAAGIGYDASGDDQGLELKGGQRGTTRRYALERKLCVEEVVPKDELRRGEVCWISNGVRGFAMAVLGQGGGLGTSSKR